MPVKEERRLVVICFTPSLPFDKLEVMNANAFQIVFLREDSQEHNNEVKRPYSCELISNCILVKLLFC